MRQAQPLFDFEFDQRMPRFEAERWGYGPPKGTASVAVACLLMAVGAVGLLAARDYLMTRRPEVALSRDEDRGRAPPVARAPDPGQVDRAYAQVRTVFAREGLPGLAREGAACFAALERDPDYARLDYCLAFDAFAGGVSRIVGPGTSEAATYFNEATVRHIQATDAVGASRTEANARLRVVSRIATSVARAQAQVAPLVVLPPLPPEPEVIEEVEDAPPPVEEETPYRVIGPQAEPAPLSDGTEITPEPVSPPPPGSTGVGSPPAPPPEPAPPPARP